MSAPIPMPTPGSVDLLNALGLDPTRVVLDSFEVEPGPGDLAVVQWEEFDENDRLTTRQSTALTMAEVNALRT